MEPRNFKKQCAHKHHVANRIRKISWLPLALACYVDSGYFTIAKPFKWNFKTGQMDVVVSKWYVRIRILLTSLAVLSTTSQIYTITRDLTEERVPLTNFTTLFPLAAVLLCGFLTMLQLHTALRAYPIKEFSNHALKYLYTMEKHGILDSPKKFDRICAVILLSVFVLVYATAASAFLGYWAKCELHILSSVLPICEETLSPKNGKIIQIHKSYLFLLIIIGLQHAAAILCYNAMITTSVLGCIVVLQKMKESTVQRDGKRNLFYRKDMLLLHYRCLQMLFNRINITLGRYVFPCGITSLLILLILTNFAAITLPFQYYFLLFVVPYSSIVIFFATIIRQGVFFSDLSKGIIDKKREDCRSVKEVFALQLGICRPLRVTCGGFFYLERMTLLLLLGAVIDYTAELLLTYSTA